MERKFISSLFMVTLLYALSFEFAEGCSDFICRIAKQKARECNLKDTALTYSESPCKCDNQHLSLIGSNSKCGCETICKPDYSLQMPLSYDRICKPDYSLQMPLSYDRICKPDYSLQMPLSYDRICKPDYSLQMPQSYDGCIQSGPVYKYPSPDCGSVVQSNNEFDASLLTALSGKKLLPCSKTDWDSSATSLTVNPTNPTQCRKNPRSLYCKCYPRRKKNC